MYYLAPTLLRSRGAVNIAYNTASAFPVKKMYYWDYDEKLYIANNNKELFKNTTAVTGPAENVVDMTSFGVGSTPKLIVAESLASQGHTLHTYTGSAYATLTGTSVPTAEKVMARYGRLFATKDSAFPSRIYFSDDGDETRWKGAYNEGGWFDVAPGQDGDIVDWLDFEGALYVWKEKAIYRVSGDHPQNFTPLRLMSSDKVVGGTAVDCAKGIVYATQYGVFPVAIASQSKSEDLSRYIEQELQAVLANGAAAYSPELGAYILVTQATTAYVSNQNNRPDVWTKFTLTPTMHSVYQGNGLYFGASDGKVYLYDHDGFKDDSVAFTVSFKTGDWDFGDKVAAKNVRFIEGKLNAKENATATVSFYEDGAAATRAVALATTARNLVQLNANCERIALGIVYTSLTGPCLFGGAALRVIGKGAIK